MLKIVVRHYKAGGRRPLQSEDLDLIVDKTPHHKFPSARRVFKLTTRIYKSGRNVKNLQEDLLSRPRNLGEHRILFEETRRALNERTLCFPSLFEAYEVIESKKLSDLTIKRLEYFLVVFRLAEVIEKSVKNDGNEKLLEESCISALQNYDNPVLLLLFWLSQIRHNRQKSDFGYWTGNSSKLEPCLREVLLGHCEDYSLDLHHKSVDEIYSETMPSIFSLGNIDRFNDSVRGIDDLPRKTLPYRAACLWKIGRFSESLKCVEEASTNLFKLTTTYEEDDDDDLKDLTAEAFPLICALKLIINDLVRKPRELAPAKEYFKIFSENLTLNYKVPLLPYLYYVSLEGYKDVIRDETQKMELEKLPKMYPQIKSMNQPVFNKIFCNYILWLPDDFSQITTNFIYYFFKPLIPKKKNDEDDVDDDSILGVQFRPSNVGDIQVSEHCLQEMLNIKVLEALKKQDFEAAVESVISNPDPNLVGILPTKETMKILIGRIREHPELLENLKRFLPIRSEAMNQVLKAQLHLNLKTLLKIWEKGERLRAMDKILMLYQSIIEENYAFSDDENFVESLSYILKYIKIFAEEAALNEDLDLLQDIRVYGQKLKNEYNDNSCLIVYWEALFFSHIFKHKKMADEFLEENPEVPKNIDIDATLERVNRYQDVEMLRRIMEICLVYDLGEYEKTRAFEELLIYQCQRGQFRNATATLEAAQNLKLHLSADSVQEYLNLQEEHKKKSSNVFRNFITDIFGKK